MRAPDRLADVAVRLGVVRAGAPVASARAVVVLLHGRNAAPQNILEIVPRLACRDVAYLAPAAPGRTWYPQSFMAETPQNEPSLSASLRVVPTLVAALNDAGTPSARIVLMGFSQGACLAAESAVRHPARYGAVVAFTGGLIGPPGASWDYGGSFDGTPVLLACSDVDAHVPASRVHESAVVFRRMGAEVTECLYPGLGHVINDDEMARARRLIEGVTVPA